ncbi:pilus assembly protein TadG-related protein [Jannaschia sp. R86511]|uniref:pilus assembly protein TadG-related protein n=1 Tax=Jannaschia sp. R86511 TaxID=3093853 RepID=UPI0036D3EE42
MRSRVRLDDSGQGMLPLMVLVAFSVLVILMSLLVPWGNATTEKSQAQTAADAAALAAVQGNREAWDTGTRAGVLTYVTALPTAAAATVAGCGSGSTYAARNEAMMTGCVPSVQDGRSRIRFDVRAQRTSDADTGYAEATATADMDVDLTACRWNRLPPVSPPPPAGTGPLTFDATLTCGAWSAEYTLGNVTGIWPTITLLDPTNPNELYNDLEPRLVR